jgi:hypothetical protein
MYYYILLHFTDFYFDCYTITSELLGHYYLITFVLLHIITTEYLRCHYYIFLHNYCIITTILLLNYYIITTALQRIGFASLRITTKLWPTELLHNCYAITTKLLHKYYTIIIYYSITYWISITTTKICYNQNIYYQNMTIPLLHIT